MLDSRRVRAKLLGVLDIVSVFHYYHILQRSRQVTNVIQMMEHLISWEFQVVSGSHLDDVAIFANVADAFANMSPGESRLIPSS